MYDIYGEEEHKLSDYSSYNIIINFPGRTSSWNSSNTDGLSTFSCFLFLLLVFSSAPPKLLQVESSLCYLFLCWAHLHITNYHLVTLKPSIHLLKPSGLQTIFHILSSVEGWSWTDDLPLPPSSPITHNSCPIYIHVFILRGAATLSRCHNPDYATNHQFKTFPQPQQELLRLPLSHNTYHNMNLVLQ